MWCEWAAHLEKSVSVSYSLSFSGVVIAAGPLSGTPASRSLAHGLSYANVPIAMPSHGAPVLEQKLLCDMVCQSTQWYIWATTWGWHDPQPWSAACLWEGHSTSNQALASWWIGRMRIQNPTSCEGKVATCWNHANTGFQTWEFLEGSCNLSAAQLSWAHPCHWSCMQGGPIWWIKGCESFLHLNHQLRKFCSTKFSPIIPIDLRRGSSRCRGQVLDETGSL